MKKLRNILCVVLTAFMVILTFHSCSAVNPTVNTIKTSQQHTTASGKNASLCKALYPNLSFVASSGLLELYFDKTTGNIGVLDSSSDFYWNALPVFNNNTAAVLKAQLTGESGSVELNSQDNCFAFQSFAADFSENGVTVTYYMSDNKETVKKAENALSPGELSVKIPVTYCLEDGSLSVTVNCADIFVSDGWVLNTVSVLPYFGGICYEQEALTQTQAFYDQALKQNENTGNLTDEEQEQETKKETNTDKAEVAENEEETELDVEELTRQAYELLIEDYMLVPDGCGALLYTKIADETTEQLSFPVYGSDKMSDCTPACLGVFGIKKQNSAFCATVCKGAELCRVQSIRSSADESKINRVFTCFEITPSQVKNDVLYYGTPYKGEISLCYRFMSGKQASYISMASSCREILIRNGLLSSKTVSNEQMPMNISVIGSVTGGYSDSVSKFEDAQDLLGLVKAKGINNINMILQGFFSNGLLQNSSSRFAPLQKLGGRSQFDELCAYASKQNLGLFVGINILSSGSGSDTARDITGQKLTAQYANPLSPYFGKETYTDSLLAVSQIGKNVIRLMNASRNDEISGFCINDGARFLYADYGTIGADITQTAETLGKNVSSFSVRNQLIVNGCGFYAVKDASLLLDVPFYTSVSETGGYVAIPFVPSVLHSTLWYSGPAANGRTVTRLELLKCVEYGGAPYFNWVFDLKSQLYYGLNINDICEFVQKMSSELSDLGSCRISGHGKVEDGVYYTEYDSGSVVYVNNNNYSVNIGNISVSPYDFIRIN